MRVALDTNVVVSGLLSPFGPPGQIMALLVTGDVVPCFDARIVCEYREVLHRPAFGFDRNDVETLLDFILDEGVEVTARPLENPLPDSADQPFLEVAIAADAEGLITGNLRHFPEDRRAGVVVMSPAEFLARWSELHRER